MLEKNQLAQLFPDSFTCETLAVLFAKMVQSDLAVAFCDGLDQPKNVVFIYCRVNHVVLKLLKNCRQVCVTQHRGSNCIWNSFACWKKVKENTNNYAL